MVELTQARKKIRDHLIAGCTPQIQRELIEINGQQVELRQMTGAQRDKIFATARIGARTERSVQVPGSGQVVETTAEPHRDHAFCVECALELLYVPGTDEHVFDPADRDVLDAVPAGTEWLQQVGSTASTMLRKARESGKG